MPRDRLNVLILPAWYPTEHDPVAGVFVRDQARAVAARHQVAVLFGDCNDHRGFSLTDRVEDGLRTIRVHWRRPPAQMLNPLFQIAACAAGLLRLRATGFRPDVIHAHVFSAGLAAVVLGRLTGVPVVVSEHYSGFALGSVVGNGRRVARFTFRLADLVCPVSQDLLSRIEGGGLRGRFRVMPNAVNTEIFSAQRSRRLNGPLRLLQVGLLTPVKGVPTLLRAMPLLRKRAKGVVLDVLGDGPMRAEYEALAQRLQLADCVRFHGRAEHSEVAAAMTRADLLVVPSEWENLPVAVLEAQVSGLPVVASAVGGIPELVDETRGALVPPGQPRDLAAAIDATLDRLGEFHSDEIAYSATKRFGAEAVAGEWDVLYRELIANRRRLGNQLKSRPEK